MVLGNGGFWNNYKGIVWGGSVFGKRSMKVTLSWLFVAHRGMDTNMKVMLSWSFVPPRGMATNMNIKNTENRKI